MHVRHVLEKYRLKPRKKWGQNFLVHQKIAEGIVSACNLQKNDIVLEIGPGLGILTRYLVETAGLVIAVEVDKRLCKYLNEVFSGYKNLEVIWTDILKFNPLSHIKKRFRAAKQKVKTSDEISFVSRNKKIKVIGNLPYYITTPIIDYLITYRAHIESAFIMVQHEVAERLCAEPGNKGYGAISCRIQFYAILKKLFTVKPSAFYPQPEVNSTLLKVNFLKSPAYKVRDENLLFKIIRAGFNQRRKTILKALLGSELIKKADRQQWEQLLAQAGITPSARAETLSLTDFVRLAEKVKRFDRKGVL